MAVDSHAVRLSPVAREIRLDIGPLLDGIVQLKDFGVVSGLFEFSDGLGECVRHAIETLASLSVTERKSQAPIASATVSLKV